MTIYNSILQQHSSFSASFQTFCFTVRAYLNTDCFAVYNRLFPSSPEPLYQNEVKCSAFDMEMIFHSRANKTHFHKKGCQLSFILKVRVFGTRKWPIETFTVLKKD